MPPRAATLLAVVLASNVLAATVTLEGADSGIALNGARLSASCTALVPRVKYLGRPQPAQEQWPTGFVTAYLVAIRDCTEAADITEPCVSTDDYHPALFTCIFSTAQGDSIVEAGVAAHLVPSGRGSAAGVNCSLPSVSAVGSAAFVTLSLEHVVTDASGATNRINIEYSGVLEGDRIATSVLVGAPPSTPPPAPSLPPPFSSPLAPPAWATAVDSLSTRVTSLEEGGLGSSADELLFGSSPIRPASYVLSPLGQIYAQAACVGLHQGQSGRVRIIQRSGCSSEHPTCSSTCTNAGYTCFDSIHVYADGFYDGLAQHGLRTYTYGGNCGGGCGP